MTLLIPYFTIVVFYDAGMQIKSGIFSIFQTNFTFQQSGRIINAIYGPLFAYFNGILVLIAGNWFNYQVILAYLISLLGAGSMYYLLKQVGINKLLAAVMGFYCKASSPESAQTIVPNFCPFMYSFCKTIINYATA